MGDDAPRAPNRKKRRLELQVTFNYAHLDTFAPSLPLGQARNCSFRAVSQWLAALAYRCSVISVNAGHTQRRL